MIDPWNAYPDQNERERWNVFKRMYRARNPHMKRNNPYYARVRREYKAQAKGECIDLWNDDLRIDPRRCDGCADKEISRDEGRSHQEIQKRDGASYGTESERSLEWKRDVLS